MIEAIKNRRSIRKYKSKAVDKEAIAQILQAETLAPSSKNRQPWKFVVATESAKSGSLSSNGRGNQAREERTFYSG